MVVGNIGMVASLVIMAILIWTLGIQSSAWIIIVCLSLFIVFFGASWGPVLWVMLPELFPTRTWCCNRDCNLSIEYWYAYRGTIVPND